MVRLTLDLGYTYCHKGEVSDIRNCQLNSYMVMLIKQIYSFHMILLDRRGLIDFRELKISYSK
jgi:hypothetical protein